MGRGKERVSFWEPLGARLMCRPVRVVSLAALAGARVPSLESQTWAVRMPAIAVLPVLLRGTSWVTREPRVAVTGAVPAELWPILAWAFSTRTVKGRG